jgi:hypothetical protein
MCIQIIGLILSCADLEPPPTYRALEAGLLEQQRSLKVGQTASGKFRLVDLQLHPNWQQFWLSRETASCKPRLNQKSRHLKIFAPVKDRCVASELWLRRLNEQLHIAH